MCAWSSGRGTYIANFGSFCSISKTWNTPEPRLPTSALICSTVDTSFGGANRTRTVSDGSSGACQQQQQRQMIYCCHDWCDDADQAAIRGNGRWMKGGCAHRHQALALEDLVVEDRDELDDGVGGGLEQQVDAVRRLVGLQLHVHPRVRGDQVRIRRALLGLRRLEPWRMQTPRYDSQNRIVQKEIWIR